ncbi:DUF6082 family protein [Nocardiopsis ansamitocini]|uniref:DUF6082 family protein n=1 Tax=Nocardiopsis ansamitocini TaxID=1670832 RepID=UPI00255769E5|nr:DUF6082 family protein [Nocardiopsis ansamitocini]
MSDRREVDVVDKGTVKPLVAVTIAFVVTVAIGLVGLSPYALRLFGESGDWQQLSLIGQTYGAVSALIAVLALVGVALTLVYQARETQRAMEETRRQAVSDLLRMAMDDPDLDECWGPLPEPDDPKTRKQRLYTNMIVSQWETAYGLGTLPERRLRAVSAEMFQGRVGRAYWADAREARLTTAGNRAQHRFSRILDEEYRRQRPVVLTAGTKQQTPLRPRHSLGTATVLALAFAGGAVTVGVALGGLRASQQRTRAATARR